MTIHVAPLAPSSESARAFLGGRKKLLIDGAWVEPASGAFFASIDPATGTTLAEIAEGSAEDVDAAVASARRAFESDAWRAMTPTDRGRLLFRIADLIEANADALAEIETLDQGKSFRTARFGEIPGAIAQFRYYGGFANKILGETIPTSIGYQPPGKKLFAYTLREPVGVVAAITPWNSPLLMAAMKLAPALAAGCTVVLKPAEDTSLTALRLGELLIEAGLPAGVVNIVTGYGRTVGAALANHQGVDKIAFTGSTITGKALLDAAKTNLKRLTLELGGKSPAIVLADADLDLAVPGTARGIFANGGQVCVAGSRIYAARPIYDAFVERLAAEAGKLRLGHGLDPNVDLGPLVNQRQADRVAAYVEGGRSDGAEILAGGEQDGTFYRPTVVVNTRPDMALMREEIFGPVVAVTPFDDVGEVLALANDSRYGLAASVWTESLSNAHRMAAALRAGTVWINCHSYFSPELPKGGHKESGWGYENGPQGLENYLETKTVCAVI
ncbi:aldehyde dehydrogenase family protein [Mesorhizobium sp. BR1-1-16]|uniref:aldehyde dehydrogenase family protein n=1 Tax=Mesorhizobium sp. BR1-1-16 TaxID=2876653 RepID=UPI001CCB335F|nr:aldehyde dehydrogenase family protein [Mesorhizobium sp. BR1-1-16]MBZ9936604.1 aldehyde dehydrogenase family protein [Mesorhizobium sp. BR1-1-16]